MHLDDDDALADHLGADSVSVDLNGAAVDERRCYSDVWANSLHLKR